jgi:hypothetical protein
MMCFVAALGGDTCGVNLVMPLPSRQSINTHNLLKGGMEGGEAAGSSESLVPLCLCGSIPLVPQS